MYSIRGEGYPVSKFNPTGTVSSNLLKNANFRKLPLSFNGSKITVSGHAHPMGYMSTTRKDQMDFVTELKKHGAQHIIALQERDAQIVSDLWSGSDSKYEFKLVHTEDFQGISVEKLDDIATFVTDKAKKGENVTIYCEGGWGRTGTVMASLVLRNLIEESSSSELNSYLRQKDRLTEVMELPGHRMGVTSLVKQAIMTMRDIDGMGICEHNTKGNSIEND
ncbi:hypothetical protein HOH45_05470 [bacterium]|nr:hypothetical protein [bacterium]